MNIKELILVVDNWILAIETDDSCIDTEDESYEILKEVKKALTLGKHYGKLSTQEK
jgi:hypothetical protein